MVDTRHDNERLDEEVCQPQPLAAAGALCWREIIRFLRQRNRIVGAIGQPVLLWVFFGAGFDRSFRIGDGGSGDSGSFLEYYFPGTLVLILLFTAIFATISLIEDRREGFLQSVLVAPIPRWSMVLGKVLGGALLALLQGILFLLLALTLDVQFKILALLQLTALMFVASIGLTSLGFAIAWRMESTQGFHAIMSLFLMPLWLLAGAIFPVPQIQPNSSWVQIVMYWAMTCNPLTYTVAAVHRLIFDGPLSTTLVLPELSTCWFVTSLSTVVMFSVAWWTARAHTKGDLL
jgi:ABC-2 type transport system permease protein